MLLSGRLGSISPNIVSGGYSYFIGGLQGGSTWLSTTKKYTISSDSVGSGTAITSGGFSGGAGQSAGFANGTKGLFTGGIAANAADAFSSSLVKKVALFTLSTEAAAAGTSFGFGHRYRFGSSNSVNGFIWGGYHTDNAGVASNTSNKYTWSSDTWATGTVVGFASPYRQSLTCHGNGEIQYVCCGFNEQTPATFASTRKYTYSNDTFADSVTLGGNQGNGAGTGNQSVMVIMGGRSTTPLNSNYSTAVRMINMISDTYSDLTALGTATKDNEAAGDDFVGIFVGHTTTAGVRKMTYATATHAAGTAVYTTNTEAPGAFHSIQKS